MPKGFKFGEPSKLINFRVPESRVSEFREIVQKTIDVYFNNGKDSSENHEEAKDAKAMFKRLYEIMNAWLIGRMTPNQISKIPDEVLEEIKQMEEWLKNDISV